MEEEILNLPNTIAKEISEQMAKEYDETMFNFLKNNGYRPKRTAKYIKGLTQRLKRKGIAIKVEEYGRKEIFENNIYRIESLIVPKFVSIEED